MRILIAEDDPVLGHFFEFVLAKFGTCTRAVNGLEAVDAFEDALQADQPFELIILDIMMPEVSGHEALHEIRAIEFERNVEPENYVPVMMCSALEDAVNIHQAHANGCIEYLVKPVGKKELERALRKMSAFRSAELDT